MWALREAAPRGLCLAGCLPTSRPHWGHLQPSSVPPVGPRAGGPLAVTPGRPGTKHPAWALPAPRTALGGKHRIQHPSESSEASGQGEKGSCPRRHLAQLRQSPLCAVAPPGAPLVECSLEPAWVLVSAPLSRPPASPPWTLGSPPPLPALCPLPPMSLRGPMLPALCCPRSSLLGRRHRTALPHSHLSCSELGVPLRADSS